MEHGDDISELSFFEDDLGEMCAIVNVKPVKKRISCKVPGCPKLFSHSSSMYRHFSHAHGSVFAVKKENATESTTTKTDLNSNETATTPVIGIDALNTFTNSTSTNKQRRESVEEEMRDLQQQLLTAGQGALFVRFQTVLETVAHADPNTIAHLKSFHRVLYKALVDSTNEAGAPRATTLLSRAVKSEVSSDAVFAMNLDCCWSSMMGVSEEAATSSSEDLTTQDNHYFHHDVFEWSSDTTRTQSAFDMHNNTINAIDSSAASLLPTQGCSMDDN